VPGERVPVLYLAPWVDFGGTDTGTVDWFRWLDRERFQLSLVTTQPSPNRRVAEVGRYAHEVWALPDILPGDAFPQFILDFVHSRNVRVVHIMNSRLGFNLLPDLKSLPSPPRTVVQLHVEEPDRTGYVRYVTSRYGNLVDAFSVVSDELVDVLVDDYYVPRRKCHMIRLGVDSAEVFNPARVLPAGELEGGGPHVLWVGRLEEQKDPALMVRVAAELKRRGDPFHLHVVGDGELREPVQRLVRDAGLDSAVTLHGARADVQRWYRGADALLMTSVFEGVPCVVYEAMAMGLPVVAPALTGNLEVLGADYEFAVAPRDDAGAYADRLQRLLRDEALRRSVGVSLRRRCESEYSAETMARGHEALYAGLLEGDCPDGSRDADPELEAPSPIRFFSRPVYGHPPVTVIIPCFNHGQWLRECIDSVRAQDYPDVEIIVVDDASDDPETIAVVDELEGEPGLTVIRHDRNLGPSAARNRAIEQCHGRYILPLDSDNLLLPGAIMAMVDQLRSAGEQVGFIYPNQQYFGTRTDYAVAPAYNLHNLMRANFCDTSSLIDRDVFDAGERYPDEHGLAHEDWDFVLELAARGVRGEPARQKTLLTRKWGFTRSDLVEIAATDYWDTHRHRHEALYRREAEIKARATPALSIIPLERVPPMDEVRLRLWGAIAAQTCADAEILLPDSLAPRVPGIRMSVRHVTPDLADSAVDVAAEGIRAARGRFILLCRGFGLELLRDPGAVEKLVRMFIQMPAVGAIALRQPVDATSVPFAPLTENGQPGAEPPWGVAWSVHWAEAVGALALDHDPVASVSAWLEGAVPVRQLQLPGPPPRKGAEPPKPQPQVVQLKGEIPGEASRALEREFRLHQPPLLPGLDPATLRRTAGKEGWLPAFTVPLCRHRAPNGLRLLTTSHTPPEGYYLEYVLGAINTVGLPGTLHLVVGDDGVYRSGEHRATLGPGERTIGYLELAAFDLLDAVHLGRDRGTGQHLLVGGDDDPALGTVDILDYLGRIEPLPLRPRSGVEAWTTPALSRERDRVIASQAEQIEALWERVNNIHNSVPGRLYHSLDWLPGLKAALLSTARRARRGQN